MELSNYTIGNCPICKDYGKETCAKRRNGVQRSLEIAYR